MILADLLYTLSQRVIIHDHWSSDLIRMTIATVASTTAFLLAKLYLSHRTGRMNFCAGAGAVSTYMVIAWAQLVAISTPSGPHDLTALNLGVLAAVTLSLVGTLQAMDIHLFRHSEPKPGRIGRALDTLDRIDQAWWTMPGSSTPSTTPPEGQPTISEDVRSLAADATEEKKRKRK